MENNYAARACAQAVRLREAGRALILSVESSCDETAVAIVLILGGAYVLRDRRRIRLCAWLSPLLLLLPLGAFALYAALNFDAAFTLFHKLLFRNDLWLLDPRTDVLIRICPESMFMDMGIRIAAYSLAGMLAVSALAAALTFIWPKGKGVS